MLKRYHANELGESGSRRVGYDAITEYAKSDKSYCRGCRATIAKGDLRLALMLQDDEGYKSKCWFHFRCFWNHPETHKLKQVSEIVGLNKLQGDDRQQIEDAFLKMHPNSGQHAAKSKAKSKVSKKRKAEEESFADDEEEERKKRKAPKTLIDKVARIIEDVVHSGAKASLQKIKKELSSEYKVDVDGKAGKNRLLKALDKGVQDGVLVKAGGSYAKKEKYLYTKLTRDYNWWEIEVAGCRIERNWNGTWGGSKTDVVTSHLAGLEMANKLIDEKIKKGWKA